MHIKFADGAIDAKEASELCKMFESYGDFFLQKDTVSSAFLEFFFIDPLAIPSQSIADLIAKLQEREDLQILHALQHKQAPKFKSHATLMAIRLVPI